MTDDTHDLDERVCPACMDPYVMLLAQMAATIAGGLVTRNAGSWEADTKRAVEMAAEILNRVEDLVDEAYANAED